MNKNLWHSHPCGKNWWARVLQRKGEKELTIEERLQLIEMKIGQSEPKYEEIFYAEINNFVLNRNEVQKIYNEMYEKTGIVMNNPTTAQTLYTFTSALEQFYDENEERCL